MWEHTAVMLPYIIIMVSTLALNHLLNRQQADKRTRVETNRFQLALLTEMQALGNLYDDNLDLLSRGNENLLSARHLALVYKGNLGRLLTLDASLLERVVAIYAENERIEAFMAASSKSATALSYRIAPDGSALATLRSMFTTAASNMREAQAAFDYTHQ